MDTWDAQILAKVLYLLIGFPLAGGHFTSIYDLLRLTAGSILSCVEFQCPTTNRLISHDRNANARPAR